MTSSTTPSTQLTSPTASELFEAGWRAAASWANREDLWADIGSPAYFAEMRAVVPGAGFAQASGLPEELPAGQAQGIGVLDDASLEDLARAEFETAMNFGVSLDNFVRLAKTVRAKMDCADPADPADLTGPAPRASGPEAASALRARKDATVHMTVIGGPEGPCLGIGDEHGGYRLAGPKPRGGGETLHRFKVRADELLQQLRVLGALEEAPALQDLRKQAVREAYLHDLENTLAEVAALLESPSQDADSLLRMLRARVLHQVATDELLRRAVGVLEQCERINPFGSVENAAARDAARGLLLRVRAVFAAAQLAPMAGLICPKCGVDRAKAPCPAPHVLDCGVQIYAQGT
jgi:hypothetical protein